MSEGILSGRSIEAAVAMGEILINPFDSSRLNPASYDLTLGDEITVYTGVNELDMVSGDRVLQVRPNLDPETNWYYGSLDPKSDNPVKTFKMGPEGFVIHPGVGYLMHTRESVGTSKYVPAIDGKSSIGRLFVFVHVTAGLGDPGYFGQYTLEVLTTYPIRLYPGMRICQMRFFTIVGQVDLYKGHYQGKSAEGAVASHAYEQFEET
jgi:dCTP deaminase